VAARAPDGFSQFVYNSRWSPDLVRLVREGLVAIKAEQHLRLFDECCALLERLGEQRLEAFLNGELFGTNADRDFLNAHNERFYALTDVEDLIALNGAWLRKFPGLQVMNADQMRAEVERRAAALPDREERKRAALENAPRYMSSSVGSSRLWTLLPALAMERVLWEHAIQSARVSSRVLRLHR
jgi:hypothetical protein